MTSNDMTVKKHPEARSIEHGDTMKSTSRSPMSAKARRRLLGFGLAATIAGLAITAVVSASDGGDTHDSTGYYSEDQAATLSGPGRNGPPGVVLADGREVWPLAGSDGQPYFNRSGEVTLIDIEAADAIIDELDQGLGKPKTAILEDGTREEIWAAEPVSYVGLLPELEKQGAVAYLKPTDRAIRSFCQKAYGERFESMLCPPR